MKTPLFSHDGKPIGIQGIFWDVTRRFRTEEQLKEQNVMLQELASREHKALEELKRTHEELKSAQTRLVQTETMASLGQLVTGVAHEINNPLSFVSNNVAVLERDLNDLLDLIELYRQGDADLEKAQPDLIEKINDLAKRIDLNYSLSNLPCLIERTREGLRRIERIVKELRLFARVDEGDWNEVDLNPGIESTINMIWSYWIRRRARQRCCLPQVLPPVSLSDGADLGDPGLEHPARAGRRDVPTGLARGSGLGNSHRSSAGARAAGPVRQEADPGLSQGAGVCLRPSRAVRTIPVAR